MLAETRAFFAARGLLEVETPYLSAAAASDPALHSLSVRLHPDQPPRYLHTSPEFPMKRLLAAGSGDIYQICRVFRGAERGRLHHPEFTLLEWYRVGFDHHRLMHELTDLVQALLALGGRQARVRRVSYRAAFREHLGVDPLAASGAQLRALAAGLDGPAPPALADHESDAWLDWLLSEHLVPRLPAAQLVIVHDYPASQAALARLDRGAGTARRFELFYAGVELANGFHELSDATEQRARFAADLERRAARGLDPVPLDERLLAALGSLPDCAGVALGLDRLLMLIGGARHIDEVLAFPAERA